MLAERAEQLYAEPPMRGSYLVVAGRQRRRKDQSQPSGCAADFVFMNASTAWISPL
jgi:hypothetical protein